MRVRLTRWFAVAALATALVVTSGAPAYAGGSAWWPDKTSYAPGEVAAARGGFGAGCCDRGWVDDGPYRVWLVPYGENSLTDLVLPPTAIPVGDLHAEQQQYEWQGSTMSRWVATTEFVVPDVPPGPYHLVHCTDPCGKGLGDLMYAFFWVGPAPDFPPAEDTPPATAPTTTDAAVTPARTASTASNATSASSASSAAVVAGVVALVSIASAAVIVVRRLRTR
jgi:hypothetical protein